MLDRIPPSVHVGEVVTFTGQLSSNGHPLADKIVTIGVDDRLLPDQTIASQLTDRNGGFAIAWRADAAMPGDSFDIYAVFDGDADYERARSYNQDMTIIKYGSSITLDSIPGSVTKGETVAFSGMLNLGGHSARGAVVYIMDDVGLGRDEIMAALTADSAGRFHWTWTAQPRSSGSWDFYAIFEGSENVNGARSQTETVAVTPKTVAPPPPPPSITRHDASIVLDRIPSTVEPGSQVTFSGSLTTASGLAVIDAAIYIKDDVDVGRDRIMATLRTDDAGRFYGTWTAQPRSSGSWDFYAVFEGSENVNGARSQTYAVTVPSSTHEPPRSAPSTSDRDASIVLNRIPSSIYVNELVTFTGQLSSNGRPLADKLVTISEDDPLLPDQTIGSQKTDRNGKFAITWMADTALIEDDFDIYAVFDGDADYERARSYNQEMTVTKYGGSITLDPIPGSAREGETVTFSGTLSLEGHGTEGDVVYIMDEDPLNPDDLLVTAYVDKSGNFSADWVAIDVDPDADADIYAVFEGNDVQHRLTTCDPGPTSSLGGLCLATIKISILEYAYQEPPSVDTTGPYMKLFYSIPFQNAPHVAIVPSPVSYDKVRSHIVPVEEGILVWTSLLEQKYGGNWDVTFERILPGNSFSSRPDVIVNIDTYETDSFCYDYYYGVAFPNMNSPVQTTVCSTFGDEKRTNGEVAATAGHEFIHAVGLGHAFNKPGDMLCSEEVGVQTCIPLFPKSRTPSDLNLEAVAHLYGTDGFRTPNNCVQYNEVFAGNVLPPGGSADHAPEAGELEEVTPPATTGPAAAAQPIPEWIKRTATLWSEGSISDGTFINAIQFLIRDGIIVVPETERSDNVSSLIPAWFKSTTQLWAGGATSDAEFINAIQFLIREGVIVV